MNSGKPIGVGLVGFEPGRSWSAVAHLPALAALTEYRVAAVATTRHESAMAAAEVIGLNADKAFISGAALATCSDVDVVAVTVKVPHHLEIVRAAVAAGKHVYCEWPLGNGLAEAEEMAKLVGDAGVQGVVGLQARCSPTIAYLRDLVCGGAIGEVLSSNMIGTGIQWGGWVDKANTYLLDPANGATLLTIPFGQRCCRCARLRSLPSPGCFACASLDWEPVGLAGNGEIYSYVTHHHPPLPGFSVPHPIAVVMMEEGVRLLGAMDGTDPADLAIGRRVRAEFIRRDAVAAFRFCLL
ncbi:MAG: OB-fold domain-containing protein [Porphyrobacter sp.]|nr:OB-fold domain-containing protein [Porphyrobacter sp.]